MIFFQFWYCFLCLTQSGTSAYYFATGLEADYVKIWNNSIEKNHLGEEKKGISIDFNQNVNVLIGSNEDKQVFSWELNKDMVKHTSKESQTANSVAFINDTHFIAGYINYFIIYAVNNMTKAFSLINNSLGTIESIKILKNSHKVLVGSKEGYISVFCLRTQQILKVNKMASIIWDIDLIDENFIVSQCVDKHICSHKINHTNSINIDKQKDYNTEIFAIKIINPDRVALGANGNKLIIINFSSLTSEEIASGPTIKCLEYFGDDVIGSGSDNNFLVFWNSSKLTKLKEFNLQSKILALKNLQNFAFNTEEKSTEFTTRMLPSQSSILNEKITNLTSDYSTTPIQINEPSIKNILSLTSSQNNDQTSSQNNDQTSSQIIPSSLEQSTSDYSTTPIQINEPSIKNILSLSSSQNNDQTSSQNNDQTSSQIIPSLLEQSTPDYSTTPIHTRDNESLSSNYVQITSDYKETITDIPNSNTTRSYRNGTVDFLFGNQDIQLVIGILESTLDMTDCLLNCSGHGSCKLIDSTKFICDCFENYAGSTCQINTLPCASNPCRNNSTCTIHLTNKTYSCQCSANNNGTSLFYGKNCEYKIDVCANETCSKQGVCNEKGDKAKCKCFNYYSGEKCEIESNEMKAIKTVIKTSYIIAGIILISLFLLIIGCDLSNICCKKKKNKKRVIAHTKVVKYQYVNN
ncbi:neurogenic locus notch-like protein [Brachionus plicatilis]|uniref:Neurogenic locus notch-like protein n=1 Tax=Brachionus plicatilis TaxID=10195 RepID=A0A3M7QK82_BRAPC|nr:neurogenic locus notch-like protein [Brachionus plicatilis]